MKNKPLAFVHINKTAGTTFKFILRNSLGTAHCDAIKTKTPIFTSEDLAFARKIFSDIRCLTGHNVIEPTKNLKGEVDCITFLRNPITRMVSHYQDDVIRGGEKMPFEKWVQNEEEHNLHTKMIAGSENVEHAKKLLKNDYLFVGITEDFSTGIKLFKHLAPFELNINFHKNVFAKDNSIKKQLLGNPETVELLTRVNKLDIELYEFAKTQVYEPLKKKYQTEIEKIPNGTEKYTSTRLWNYQSSIFFNKYIYRQIIKMSSRYKKS